jgi:ParB/RepB/Spo0J family partition protein
MSLRVKLPAPIVPRPADAVIVVDELVMDGYCDLPLWMIRASRTNRTYFSVDALQQLADNIAEVGVLQPILVRPVTPTDEHPQHYEIIAGERRFRAAVMAALPLVPVRVRAMTDLQAAELQLIENLQREDPHPLEEAEGMQTLMLNHGYNADQVAAAVKQSRSYVYGRLKLCELAKSVREQFMGEQFNASIGLLIARLPSPDLQAKAVKEIQRNGYYGEPMSYRAAREHIRHNYMLDLAKAIFPVKDAKLLEAAGSCTGCPKRAGNQPEIYTDEKDADVCTEPACYHEKAAAFQQQKVDQAAKKGMPIITGAAAKKIMPNDYGSLRGGFSDIDKKMYLSSGATSYREILGKGLPQVSLLENPHARGKYIHVARTDDLEDLVEAKAGKGKTEASQAAAAKAREKKQEREAAIERQYRKDLFMAVRINSDTSIAVYDEREVAVLLFRNCPDYADAFLRKVYGWDGKEFQSGWVDGQGYVNGAENVYKAIRAMGVAASRQLVRDLVLVRDIGVNTYTPGNETPAVLLAAAEIQGIDAAAMREELAKAASAKEKEKADKAKTKAAKVKRPAQAEIAMEADVEEPAPAADHEAAEQSAGTASIDLAVLQDADTLRAFIAADPGKLNDLTPIVILHAPHLLKTVDVAGHEAGYMWRDNEWHAPAPRKTLTLKARPTSQSAGDEAAAEPMIQTKKPARTVVVPTTLAYTAPDTENE